MGKVTGFLEIKRQGPALVLLLLCLVASSQSAHACRLSPPPPSDESLRAAPNEAAVAAKGIIRRIIADGPMNGIPHRGFRLELQVVRVFKGEPTPLIVVAYGPCHFVPGDVGETVNVVARKGFNDELVAY